MSERDERLINRVIVLVSDSADSGAALEAAARLAARRGAEVRALFVEDVNLLRSAGLPFAREIGLTSATPRPLSTEAVEHRLRAQAERSRRLLERIRQRFSISASFHVSRGDVEREVLGSAQPEDMLVVCRAERSRHGGGRLSDRENRIAAGARCTVMFIGNRQPEDNRPVLVLYANTNRGRRSLALAAAMARETEQPLVVLLPPGTPEEHQQLGRSAREWAQSHGLQMRLHPLSRIDGRSLITALRKQGGQSLVLQRDSPALNDPYDRFLLDEVDTPVVVVP